MNHSHCHDFLHNLSEYVDGELDPDMCAELERHLCGCERCRVVVNTLKKTVELYHEDSTEANLPDGVRERLFLRMNFEDFRKK